MSDGKVLDEEFRAAGFTGAARNYPLNDEGFAWLCAFNGIAPEQAPRAWRYAPNAYMKEYIEQKAREQRVDQ